jgi:Flp pilus assembly protein TadD
VSQEWLQSAIQHHQAGRLQEAEALYQQILAQEPNHADALHRLGLVLLQTGRRQEARALLGRAIQIDPSCAQYHCNLGFLLAESGEAEQAIDAFHRALQLRPDLAEACNNLGIVLLSVGRVDEAIAVLQRAVTLQPNYANAHHNLGAALYTKGDLDGSLSAFAKAAQLQPDSPDTLNELGRLLRSKGDLEGAAATFRRAIALAPDLARAHCNLGLLLLLKGEYREGWKEYEWWQRLQGGKLLTALAQLRGRMWDGSELRGRRILLMPMGWGLGDQIQLVRYVPLVQRRGGKIILQCDPPLRRLFQRLDGLHHLITSDQPAPEYDVHCPLIDLPRVFDTNVDTIPAAQQYLHADPSLIESWRNRLTDAGGRLKVGLAWAGRADYCEDRTRTIALTRFTPLLQVPDIWFCSLQKGKAAEQIQTLPADLRPLDWTADLNDLADTAALIHNLDLIIAVDTAVAHLAGALGKPVWMPIPFTPDWRWMLNREDTPWYPTMRLFRQRAMGDWETPIHQIEQSLRSRVRS